MLRVLVLIILIFLTGIGHAQDGSSLFQGQGLQASLTSVGIKLSGEAASCARCHGARAAGAIDGGIPAPPLQWQRLGAAAAHRPAYDEVSLLRALRDGRDPAGRALSPLMPRYEVTQAQARQLKAFLETLSVSNHPAVTDEALYFLVPYLTGEEVVPELLDALWANPGRRAWGRRLRARPLMIDARDRASEPRDIPTALASVSGPGRRVPWLDGRLHRLGILHIAPVDSYVEGAPGVLLAEAPLAEQVMLLIEEATSVGANFRLVCDSGEINGIACSRAEVGDARRIIGRAARVEDTQGLAADGVIALPLDYAAALLQAGGEGQYRLLLADPRGRAMPAQVREELARLAPELLSARPEFLRRIYAAAELAVHLTRLAGPTPSPEDIVAAVSRSTSLPDAALLAPSKDGSRLDGRYGVQILEILQGQSQARLIENWRLRN
jgi:hypothetical protein